jgi:hypothetical protein
VSASEVFVGPAGDQIAGNFPDADLRELGGVRRIALELIRGLTPGCDYEQTKSRKRAIMDQQMKSRSSAPFAPIRVSNSSEGQAAVRTPATSRTRTSANSAECGGRSASADEAVTPDSDHRLMGNIDLLERETTHAIIGAFFEV